jgi:hypothetical protein
MFSAGGALFIASGLAGDHLFVIAFEPRYIEGYGFANRSFSNQHVQFILVANMSLCILFKWWSMDFCT